MGKKTKSRGGGAKGKSRSRCPSRSSSRQEQTHAETSNPQQEPLTHASTPQPEDIYEDEKPASQSSTLCLEEKIKTKSSGGGKGKSRSRCPSRSSFRQEQTHAETSNPQQESLTHASTPQPEDTYEDEKSASQSSTLCLEEKIKKQESLTPQELQTYFEDGIFDGILCSILSRLPLKEAVRTCVLSRRWRHIWTYLPRFIFFPGNMLDSHILKLLLRTSPLTSEEKYQLLMKNTPQFIGYVNSVLQQHQGSRVEELKFQFFLHNSHSHHLDNWFRFGVDCKTEKFAFFLEKPFPEVSDSNIQPYNFPCHLLGSSSIKILSLSNCFLKVSDDFTGLKRLTTLTLIAVAITEDDITHVLANCSSLKKLCLRSFQKWETLTIPHALSQLRSLVIKDCELLTRVKIICDNLSDVTYWGVPVEFEFSRSPCVDFADIYFETKRCVHSTYFYLTKLPRSFPHLRSLIFHVNGVPKVADLPRTFNGFVHLKCLDWIWNADIKMSPIHLAALLDAAPFLEECKLRLSTHVSEQAPQRLTKLAKLLPTNLHSHLKKILISNFCCDKWHIEIALFLMKNAVELELMTILRGHVSVGKIHNVDIKNLLQEVPVKAKIVIL